MIEALPNFVVTHVFPGTPENLQALGLDLWNNRRAVGATEYAQQGFRGRQLQCGASAYPHGVAAVVG